MFVNEFVRGLLPYKVVSHKAWEIEDKASILKLDWNESTYPPSPKVKEALIKFASNGLMNWYPDVDNIKLREKLAEYSEVDRSNIEYFASSDGLHEYIIRAFFNPGDVITLLSPTYDNFRAVSESVGAKIDYYVLSEERGFKFDVSLFEAHINKIKPRIVYICNPNNPTGTVISASILEHLVKEFNEVLFIIDEAYYEFEKVTAKKLAIECENIVICRTFSKAFGLASFRVGYAISSKSNISNLGKIRNPKNISACAQVAALAALEDIEYMTSYVGEVEKGKIFFRESMVGLNVSVADSLSGGNYLLLKLGNKKKKIIEDLEKNLIFVRNFENIILDEYLRITMGSVDQMKRVVTVISESLESLSN